MICRSVAKPVDDFPGNTVGILFRLYEKRWDRANEDSFCHPSFSMLCDITSDFTATGRVPNVDSIFQVQLRDELIHIGSISVHIVAFRGLRGSAVAPSVVGDHAVAMMQKKHHLGIPVVGGERPSMVKEERLPFTPILVKNLGAVLNGYGFHSIISFCKYTLDSGWGPARSGTIDYGFIHETKEDPKCPEPQLTKARANPPFAPFRGQ